MRFKATVRLYLDPEMAEALPLIDQAHKDIELPRLAYITSANDGKHMDGSLHPKGRALDLRINDLPQAAHEPLVWALRERLNGSPDKDRPFNVVLERPKLRPAANWHIHVEYDPK